MKTQVAILGAWPTGLLRGHPLLAEGTDCVIVERQSRAHILSHIRAGVLEAGTVALIDQLALAQRLHVEGIVENGFCLADSEQGHSFDGQTAD